MQSMYVWLGWRLISRVLEWATCLRCGTGKPGIFDGKRLSCCNLKGWKTSALEVFVLARRQNSQDRFGASGADRHESGLLINLCQCNVVSGCGWRNYEHVAFLCLRSFSNVLKGFGAPSLHTTHDDHHRTASSLTSARRLAVVGNRRWPSGIIGDHPARKCLLPVICRCLNPQQVAQLSMQIVHLTHRHWRSLRPCPTGHTGFWKISVFSVT